LNKTQDDYEEDVHYFSSVEEVVSDLYTTTGAHIGCDYWY